MEKFKKNIKQIQDKGGNGIWKIKNNFFQKNPVTLPTGKKNKSGQIITNQQELKEVYLDHFKHRMRDRPILPELETYKKQIENEFKLILEETAVRKTKNWDTAQLDRVLKTLKSGQSKDAKGLANELFAHANIGSDLKNHF